MSKGVSTIIAVLLMLVITVSLSITAFSFVTNFFEQSTSGMVELSDIACDSNSCSITVRNLDDIKSLDPSLVNVKINNVDVPTSEISWTVSPIPAGGTSTGTISSTGLSGLAADTPHTIKVIGTSGRPQTQVFEIPVGGDDPPIISSVTISDSTPEASDPVKFTATAADDNDLESIRIIVNGVQAGLTCTYPGTSDTDPLTCDRTQPGGTYSAGITYSYQAIAKDSSDNEINSIPETFTVEGVPSPPDTSPVLDTNSPSHSPTTTITETTPVTITASATDDNGIYKIEISVDGSVKNPCIFTSPYQKTQSCSTDAQTYTAGSHPYSARVTDSKTPTGNTDTGEGSFTVGTANVKPTFGLGSPSHSPSGPTSTVEITATANDDDLGLDKIDIFVGVTKKTCSDITTTSYTCKQTFGPYSAGTTQNYYAIATDDGGLTATSATKNFMVYPQVYMSDTPAAAQAFNVYSLRPVVAEYVATSSSVLVGKKIDSITVRLKKVGTLTGNIEIGVFDVNGNLKPANAVNSINGLFGTKNAADTDFTTAMDFTFTLPSTKVYTIESGDRIGVKFTGGDAVSPPANYVNTFRDIDTTDLDSNGVNIFDGINTHLTFCSVLPCTSWVVSFPNTGYDLYMILQEIDPVP